MISETDFSMQSGQLPFIRRRDMKSGGQYSHTSERMLLLWAQLVTGSWSKKAAEEASKYANVNIMAKGDNRSIPARNTWKLSPGAKFVHYCDNETIQVRWSTPGQKSNTSQL